jgi:hypothetical protein
MNSNGILPEGLAEARLERLLDEQAITQDEYETLKNRLL